MQIDELSKSILSDLLADFSARGFSADALRQGYVGVSLASLWEKHCLLGRASEVDFDLAIDDLEKTKTIRTGPMEPYKNPPGSSIVVVAIYSKQEYAYLTEKGYKAAHKKTHPAQAYVRQAPQVHISGGHFHQSPIGVGTNVTQSVNMDLSSNSEAASYLIQLLSQTGSPVDVGTEQNVLEMVERASQGNLSEAKPLFQKLFGAATESVKQVAWGVLTAIITKQMGIG